MMNKFEFQVLDRLQREKIAVWHHGPYVPSQKGFLRLVEENHYCNFELWHEEDRARRDDMGYEFVYRAKRKIDAWNQKRNDFIEKMDLYLAERLPGTTGKIPMNSETPGMIIDRLSILHLKLFHMKEEAERKTAGTDHRRRCSQRLAVIERQRRDLFQALEELMADLLRGKRGFRVYHQFKMYNDPTMNPELYKGPQA